MQRIRFLLLALALTVLVGAVACAGAPQVPTSPAPPPTEEAAPAATTAADTGGNLVYTLPADVVGFDPHTLRETVSGMVNLQIFETLLVLTPDGNVTSRLATSWEPSDDNLTWTLTLRDDVTFHDGTKFNAEAVKANFDRVLDPDNALPAVRVLAGVEEVNVVDEYTIDLVTQAPFGPLPFHLAHYSLGMVSPAALEGMSAEELSLNPIGTGPFKFVSYAPNESIVLERNPDYWGTVPSLDSVTFRPVPEDSNRAVLVETGEAHVAAKIAPQDVELLRDVEGLHVDVEPFPRVVFLHLNHQKEPFNDVQVRQALSWGVDRQSIVDNLLRGFASVATGPVGSGVFGYAPTDNYGYDPERASDLLAEAGYPDGFTTTLWVPAGRYQGGEVAAEAVQAQLADIGVDVNVEVIEWSTLLSSIRKGPDEAEWEMLLLGFIPATNDADWQLFSQFHCESWAPLSNNRSFFCDPGMDELLEAGRFSMDPEERQAAYAEAIQLAVDQAVELYLYETTQIYGVRDSVAGLTYLPIDYQFLETVSLEE